MLICPGLWVRLIFKISQGSVGPVLRWSGKYYTSFVENLIFFGTVQKLWKLVHIWQSYHRLCNVLFLWTTVYTRCITFVLLLWFYIDFFSLLWLLLLLPLLLLPWPLLPPPPPSARLLNQMWQRSSVSRYELCSELLCVVRQEEVEAELGTLHGGSAHHSKSRQKQI